MEVEDEAESRKKLGEQKRKLQKELRDVDRLPFVSKEMQESIKESLQHSCKRWRKGGMISCLSTRMRTKKSQKIQSFQDKRRNLQKESLAAKEEMRMLQEEIGQREERHFFSSNKVEKNKMQEAEMVAELQSLHTGEERRGSNASQTGDCCLETLWQQFIALGANQFAFVQRLQREMGTAQGQMPGIEEGRREPVSSLCCPRLAGSVKMHQRVVWSLGSTS